MTNYPGDRDDLDAIVDICSNYERHGLIAGPCPVCGFDMLASFETRDA